jgi:hypothetical protein
MSQTESTLNVVQPFSRVCFRLWVGLFAVASVLHARETSAIEIRGLLQVNDRLQFNILDTETGHSWWTELNRPRYGLKPLEYDPSTKELRFQWRGEEYVQGIAKSDGLPQVVLFSRSKLSAFNRTLLEKSPRLIRKTISPETGRLVRDQKEVARLQKFLRTNPSVTNALNTLPDTFGDQLDYEVFLNLDAPSIMKSRNRQNTARWEVRDNVDEGAVVETLRNNPSAAALNQLIAKNDMSGKPLK